MSKYSWSIISGDFGLYIPLFDQNQYYHIFDKNIAISPFKYRILTPLLANFLPFELVINFYLLNIFFMYCTIIVYYFYLKSFDFLPIESAIGISIFLVSHVVLYNFFLPMTDSLTHLFLISCFYLLRIRKQKFIPIILFLALFNHESIVVFFPVWFIHSKNKKLVLFLVLLFLLELFCLRIFLGFQFGATKFYLSYLLHNFLTEILFIGQTFLFIWIGFWNIQKNSWLKKSTIELIVILPLCFLATHTGRLLFLIHPVLIPLYLFFIKNDNKNKINIK